MFRSRLLKRSFSPVVLVAVAGLMIASVVALSLVATAGASQETVVTLLPSGSVRPGEVVTVHLVANNAHNVAGFQGAVAFDENTLALEQAVVADGLKASGRDIVPFSPITRSNTVVLGAATCPVASCIDPQGARAPRVLQGVDGQVELGTLSFRAKAPGTYALQVNGVQLVDPQGNRLAATTQSAVVTVTAP